MHLLKTNVILIKGCYLLLGGDANSHISELDGRTNPRGKLLEEFAVRHGLIIVNLTNKCAGRFTRGTSAIDFVLTNTSAYEVLETMRIDETREITDTSDRNLLTVECRTEVRKIQTKKKIWSTALSKAASETEKIPEKVQAQNNVSYQIFRNTLMKRLNRNKRRMKISHTPMVHSQITSALESTRKQKDREWRELRRLCLPTDGKEREVREAQQAVRERKFRKNSRQEIEKYGLRSNRLRETCAAKNFGNTSDAREKNEMRRPDARDVEGNKIPTHRSEDFLTDVAQRKLLGKEAAATSPREAR